MARIVPIVLVLGLCSSLAPAGEQKAAPKPSTLKVIKAIQKGCTDNAQLGKQAIVGDALTEKLVRLAADEALKLPAEHQLDAFMTGVGIGLDRFNYLAQDKLTKFAFSDIEPLDEAKERQRVLRLKRTSMFDEPYYTAYWARGVGMNGRSGPMESEWVALRKEGGDALTGDGKFGWANVNAGLAGIEFSERLIQGSITLKAVSAGFTVKKVMPDPKTLPAPMTAEQFKKKYGQNPSTIPLDMLDALGKEFTDLRASVKKHFDAEWPKK